MAANGGGDADDVPPQQVMSLCCMFDAILPAAALAFDTKPPTTTTLSKFSRHVSGCGHHRVLLVPCSRPHHSPPPTARLLLCRYVSVALVPLPTLSPLLHAMAAPLLHRLWSPKPRQHLLRKQVRTALVMHKYTIIPIHTYFSNCSVIQLLLYIPPLLSALKLNSCVSPTKHQAARKTLTSKLLFNLMHH